MADRWTLVTPTGNVDLNATFAARTYQPGGVDASAALRRDDRRAYQRSGDGLRTPGPLVLYGIVARDDQDVAAIVDELNDIRDAVAACTSVVRTTSAGTYTYSGLSGGPTPEVTPDGLGGWRVVIELWPQRAAATFVPTTEPVELLAAGVEFFSFSSDSRTINVAVPGGTAPAGSLIILGIYGSGTITNGYDAVNLNGAGNLSPLATRSGQAGWAFRVPVASDVSSLPLDVSSFYGIAHTVVVAGQGNNTADLSYVIAGTTGSGTSVGITGTATKAGLQIFIGGITSFGIG